MDTQTTATANSSEEFKVSPRYTKDDIHDNGNGSCTIETETGLTVTIKLIQDDDSTPPWDREDGHGPVSAWTRRTKNPGELILAADRESHRFYDFQEAVRIARKDGWGSEGETKGERAHRAALADYERLRQWCNGDWFYAGVTVEARRVDNDALWAEDSLCGIESDGDYWREVAAEMVNDCIAL